MIPWSIVVGNLGIFGYWIMMLFLVILTIGFVYEWKKGALNWN
jgi:NADH-quinone oxidoreductase subunit A